MARIEEILYQKHPPASSRYTAGSQKNHQDLERKSAIFDQTNVNHAKKKVMKLMVAMVLPTLMHMSEGEFRQSLVVVVVVVVEASEVWSSRAIDSLHCIVPIWLNLPVGLQWLHLQIILHVQGLVSLYLVEK